MIMPDLPELPVTAVLPDLRDALSKGCAAVLVAPPGAGKTTLVPLSLLDAPWFRQVQSRILLLEPRRLAARAAARRMANLLGEEVGETVGYAMRMESKVSGRTRVLVVTEGVLSRMILEDPELSGISAIIFDEFHERSLDGDFGLALALDVQEALRPDLRLLVMSATLDGTRVASLMRGAPVIESRGRSFPIEIRHQERQTRTPIEEAMADAIRRAVASEHGSLLAFLPGQREIERTAARLAGRLCDSIDVIALSGRLDSGAQDAAIRPAPKGRRKVVLATSIAETSLTIDGVRVVVDSGLSRLPKYEPATGLTRLETVRVSRASAEQRAGRAGRTQSGVAIRLWRAEQTAALAPFTPPEILQADLSGLVLDCAAFGLADPAKLSFLDPPPAPSITEARALLVELKAIDRNGRVTKTGDAMRKLALPVRLGHMIVEAARQGHAGAAAELAVVLTDRGLGGPSDDVERRIALFRQDRSPRAAKARALAERLVWTAEHEAGNVARAAEPTSTGALLLQAWPDRVAMARGAYGRYVLANGRGAVLDAASPLAKEKFLVVADLQGKAQNARIVAAAPVEDDEIRRALADRLEACRETAFDPEKRAVRVRETVRLGAIVLAQKMLPTPSGADADRAIVDAVYEHGLSVLRWSRETRELRARLQWLRRTLGEPWPDMSDGALLQSLEDWLRPFLTGEASLDRIAPRVLHGGLMSRVPHDLQRRIEDLAPAHFEAPTGNRLPIRYDGEQPVLAIRVQELFGLDRHPSIANAKVPLKLELLSPAHRPIQTTRDLPGFWRGSWAEVRTEMRGRYPKHSWPEDPLQAQATNRARPRLK
jgi:ATP-dependent helicase HrpB